MILKGIEERRHEVYRAEMAAQGKTFDTPQALLRGVMELLNPTEGAEKSFAAGFKGEADPAAEPPPAGSMA